MITIDMQNVQAIGVAHMEFPENSIIEFSGDNSNGKSILSKIIQALTSGDIRHKDVRRTLIKDGTECGIVSIIHNKEQLGIILREEVADSIVSYNPDMSKGSESAIYRSLNDGEGVNQLVRKFGFRTYSDGDICLQLSPTWGAIPFVTTSGSVNNDIVQDITVDKIAQNFIDSFKTITYPAFRQRLKNLKSEREHLETVLSVIDNYDWREYNELVTKLKRDYEVIKDYRFITINDIPLAEKPEYHLPKLKIRDIHMPRLVSPIGYVKDLSDALEAYQTVRKGFCPTCGRPFLEG
jgi:hypothetical protein